MAQLQRLTIKPPQRQAKQIVLTPEQQHYLARVLRLGPGDRFIALDGDGQQWIAELGPISAQAAIVETYAPQASFSQIPLILMAALPKNGFDDVVRQATELGATQIIPVISDRTLLRPSPQKLQRWRRIACEATEQSEHPTLPQIQEPTPFPQALQQTIAQVQYICITRRQAPPLLTHLLESTPSETAPSLPIPLSYAIAIGPEGGWTESEVEQAIAAGYQPVSLGQGILRAVTAPIVALSVINAALEFRDRGDGEDRGDREDGEAGEDRKEGGR
ncbi:MAG: 16S rRNA (uracil(1498)-N(3))-methyltransferase [Leptolyngbyaceae cyanobacterium MO_188.B28]|nr:16S rRNA (uracil(1498)-N(3))-methyltransferase [Leptolyngbyaceae cyanobacterium MO_188.B28]